MMNIFIGNLNFRLSEEELKESFGKFGEVSSAKIITDKYTGRSKGFGFIEMENDDQATQAIEELNGSELGGRNINVNQARERSDDNKRTDNRE